MKRLLVLLLCCFAMPGLRAQEVIYSNFDKFDYRNDEYRVIGMVGDRFYTYRYNSSGAMLDAYDDSMVKQATVLLDFFPQKIYTIQFVTYADRMIVLYQAQESNKIIQYAALLDERGLLINKPIELGTAKTGILGATRTYFSCLPSDDKKTILVYSANDRGKEIEFEGKWLDDKLTIVKRSKAVFKAENAMEHNDVCLGNDGTVYMMAYTTAGAQNYADQFWLLTLPQGATRFVPHELPLQDKYAASAYMKVDNRNNRLYLGGFFCNKKNGSYSGIIYAAYDIAAGKWESNKLIPFDGELLSSAGAKRPSAMDHYRPTELIVRNDGGFVLISEVQYMATRSSYSPGFGYYSYYSPALTSTVHEYHYDDIMALSYDKDGQRQWHSFIPKEQYSQEDGGVFSSYSLLNAGGSLAFLYNDFNIRHSRIQLATLSPEGKTEIHPVEPEGNDNPDWLPRSGKQISARELVIPCFRKKQICFARVSF